MKVLSQTVRDWQIASVLRYQSGQLIPIPSSQNGLTAQLGRTNPLGFTTNFGNNYQNWNGQPLFNVDPNCGCFNPQTTQVLNPKAWTDPAAGTWGSTAPFLNNFRWQRQPAESLSLARNFRVGKEGRYNLQVRGEFQNIFNRVFLALPASTGGTANPLLPITTTSYAGNGNVINSGGFGSITTIGTGQAAQPRSGQIIVKFSF
jgi:hypothetical protein